MSKVPDPEMGKPITELDMIRNVTVEDGQVIAEVLLTIAGCPRKGA